MQNCHLQNYITPAFSLVSVGSVFGGVRDCRTRNVMVDAPSLIEYEKNGNMRMRARTCDHLQENTRP